MKHNNWVLTIGIALVVGAAAFFGGIQYQKMQMRSNIQGMMMRVEGGQGGNRAFGMGTGGRAARNGMEPIIGEVVSQDADSITVKLQDGSSKIVNIASSTTISKTDSGAKEDIKVGTQIAAFGTTNSDGSVTAQNLQLNPMFRIKTEISGSPAPTK
jgi:hypothetical protein